MEELEEVNSEEYEVFFEEKEPSIEETIKYKKYVFNEMLTMKELSNFISENNIKVTFDPDSNLAILSTSNPSHLPILTEISESLINLV